VLAAAENLALRQRGAKLMTVHRTVAAMAAVGALVLFASPAPASALSEQDMLEATDGTAIDLFGSSVSVSGTTAIVGSPQDEVEGVTDNSGSAYVFTSSGPVWAQQQKLIAADGVNQDFFGYAVAVSGDTAVVGAYGDDIGFSAQGSAYVYVRSAGVWTLQQKLIAADADTGDRFGWSVAVAGNTIVVGAQTDSAGGSFSQGSAYVYTRSGTVWTEQQKLVAADGTSSDQFGESVAVVGDTAVVGAVRDNFDQGSAYVFTRSGTLWTQQQKLNATDAATNDGFGISVGVAGNTAVVGAYRDVVGGLFDKGSAYVFTRSGTVWTQQQKLTASDGLDNDRFGSSVAVNGDTAAVGASWDHVGANADQGTAYLFTRSGTVWTEQQHLIASDGADSDHFGNSVALTGDTALVGAYTNDVGSNGSQGSAYAFATVEQPALSIANRTLDEGAAGTKTFAKFKVTLSAPSGVPVTVQYATANGTGTAGSDYVAKSGSLTFAPGETVLQIKVKVRGDATVEGKEAFFVNLSLPVGATIADGQGRGTIRNDD
jgi:hypothetical protein